MRPGLSDLNLWTVAFQIRVDIYRQMLAEILTFMPGTQETTEWKG